METLMRNRLLIPTVVAAGLAACSVFPIATARSSRHAAVSTRPLPTPN